MEIIKDYAMHYIHLIGEAMSGLNILVNILDIIILSFVIFAVYHFIKERRAGKLAWGVIICVLFLVLCVALNLRAMQFILSSVFQLGIVFIALIFQPELRSALEKLGDTSIKRFKQIGEQKNNSTTIALIDEFCEAVADLSRTKTGALIVFERNTKLGDIILTGTIINAQFSGTLMKSLFFDKAPLHDGAVVIRANRIHSAGCLLPLESDRELYTELGTRHRAAIGVSEVSDCVSVVVSEETGTISLAHEGKLFRNFTKTSLKKKLQEYLVKSSQEHKKTLSSKVTINSDEE